LPVPMWKPLTGESRQRRMRVNVSGGKPLLRQMYKNGSRTLLPREPLA